MFTANISELQENDVVLKYSGVPGHGFCCYGIEHGTYKSVTGKTRISFLL
jgi:hypothetical protein